MIKMLLWTSSFARVTSQREAPSGHLAERQAGEGDSDEGDSLYVTVIQSVLAHSVHFVAAPALPLRLAHFHVVHRA